MGPVERATFEIREAFETDLPGILRVYSQSGIDSGQSFSLAEAREHVKRFKAYPNYRLFAGVIRDEVVGTYSLLIMDNLAKRGKPSGIVEDVAVLPSHQGQGIGKAMMAHALDQCRQAGCYKLALSSNLIRTSAHRFYKSLGFERHGYSFWIRI